MNSIFLASWGICLDKSMSVWYIIFTCPVWIFCPRKPHQFGNYFHAGFCALSIILFVVELVEVKDHPLQSGIIDFEDLGRNTMGLLLRMMKRYFSTVRYVIIDSGFCVLKGLIQLRKKSFFSCAILKKRR